MIHCGYWYVAFKAMVKVDYPEVDQGRLSA